MNVDASRSGKSYIVYAWDEISLEDLEAILPQWAKTTPPQEKEVVDRRAYSPVLGRRDSSAVKKEIEGIPESELNQGLNQELKYLHREVKQNIRETI